MSCRPWACAAHAAPAASARLPATTPVAPSTPFAASTRCIDPPRPPHRPVRRPSISAKVASISLPLASTWPCPRWLVNIASSALSCVQTPTATASCPVERCGNPGISPAAASRCTWPSNRRIRQSAAYISFQSANLSSVTGLLERRRLLLGLTRRCHHPLRLCKGLGRRCFEIPLPHVFVQDLHADRSIIAHSPKGLQECGD